MFTVAIGIIKVMTLLSFVLVGLFIMLELFTRKVATRWEKYAEPHLQVVSVSSPKKERK